MATCCFTGHRPNKLGGYNYNSSKNLEIKSKLRLVVTILIEEKNVDTFIFGGALGLDQMAFEIVHSLKDDYPQIKLIVAVPFKNQAGNWIPSSISYYENQLKLADEVVFVDTLEKYKIKTYEEDIYYPAKMQKRNEYMVDLSDYIVTYFDGTKGGTKNCLDYWKKKKNEEPINIYS